MFQGIVPHSLSAGKSNLVIYDCKGIYAVQMMESIWTSLCASHIDLVFIIHYLTFLERQYETVIWPTGCESLWLWNEPGRQRYQQTDRSRQADMQIKCWTQECLNYLFNFAICWEHWSYLNQIKSTLDVRLLRPTQCGLGSALRVFKTSHWEQWLPITGQISLN